MTEGVAEENFVEHVVRKFPNSASDGMHIDLRLLDDFLDFVFFVATGETDSGERGLNAFAKTFPGGMLDPRRELTDGTSFSSP